MGDALKPLNERFKAAHGGKRLDGNGFGDEVILNPGERFEQYEWEDKSTGDTYSMGSISKFNSETKKWEIDRYVAMWDVDGVALMRKNEIYYATADQQEKLLESRVAQDQVLFYKNSPSSSEVKVSANDPVFEENVKFQVKFDLGKFSGEDDHVIFGESTGRLEVYKIGEDVTFKSTRD